MNKKVNIANVKIDNVTLAQGLELIEGLIQKREPCYVVNPNVDGIVQYQKDQEFSDYVNAAALSFVDGMPVIWAAKFLGEPLKEKISGSDLVPQLCKLSQEKGYKIFFLGGRPQAALRAKEMMEKRYPGTQIVGTHCPEFGFERNSEQVALMLKSVRESGADILLVGLGYPKQERFIRQYYKTLNVTVCMGVGVTFEFIAGMVRRAPFWMQKSGLEWFWRLVMEPRRLWKRYLVDDLKFFPLIFKQKWQRRQAIN